MVQARRVLFALLALALPLLVVLTVWADNPRPLTEADLLKLVELQTSDKAIIARVEKAGINFKVDDAVLERLKKAGASAGVLAAVRKGQAVAQNDQEKPPAPGKPAPSFLIRGHTNIVHAVAISPDNNTLATGSDDKTIRLWDLTTQKRLHLLRHTDPVKALTFSRDGKTLAVGDELGNVSLWDVQEAKKGATFTTHYPENSAYSGSTYPIRCVALAPDGKFVAAINACPNNDDILFWDTTTGKHRNPIELRRGHLYGLAFAPNSRTLVTAGDDETVRLWDVETGKAKDTLKGHDGSVNCVAYAPDGKHLASVGTRDKTVTVWDLSTGNVAATLEGHQDSVRFVAYVADGKTLVSLDKAGMAIFWDPAAGKMRARIPYAGQTGGFDPAGYAVSPDGHFLAIGDWGEEDVNVYDLSQYTQPSKRP